MKKILKKSTFYKKQVQGTYLFESVVAVAFQNVVYSKMY